MSIEMQFVESSNVEQIGYDEPNQELHVRFLNSNITYVYVNVPEYIFGELAAAESKGKYIGNNVKKQFRFRKE